MVTTSSQIAIANSAPADRRTSLKGFLHDLPVRPRDEVIDRSIQPLLEWVSGVGENRSADRPGGNHHATFLFLFITPYNLL